MKPNRRSRGGDLLDASYVCDQLRASGVVETARLCSRLLPHRLTLQHFIARFRTLLPQDTIVYDLVATPVRDQARAIAERFCRPGDRYQIARDAIFLTPLLYERIVQRRHRVEHAAAAAIQRAWRRRLAARARCRAAATIQRAWRRLARRRNAAARKIQLRWRRFVTATTKFTDLSDEFDDLEVVSLSSSDASSQIEFVSAPQPTALLPRTPSARLKRPFRFNLFGGASVAMMPMLARLVAMETSAELRARTRRWYLTYTPNRASRDDVNILPFVDAVPLSDLYRLRHGFATTTTT